MSSKTEIKGKVNNLNFPSANSMYSVRTIFRDFHPEKLLPK